MDNCTLGTVHIDSNLDTLQILSKFHYFPLLLHRKNAQMPKLFCIIFNKYIEIKELWVGSQLDFAMFIFSKTFQNDIFSWPIPLFLKRWKKCLFWLLSSWFWSVNHSQSTEIKGITNNTTIGKTIFSGECKIQMLFCMWPITMSKIWSFSWPK